MARPKNFQENKGVSALAREVKQSISNVSRKLRDGKTPDDVRREAAAWHAKETKEEAAAKTESFHEAKTRKERLLGDLRALELAHKRSELVPLIEVNAYVSTMVIRARDILTRISPELADVLAQTSDPNRVRELIDVEVTRALTQLAEYRPD